MASESFIHALLLFLGLFLHISLWVPLNKYWYPYQAIEKRFYCLTRRWLSCTIHIIRGQRGAASITFHSVMSSNGSLSSDYTCYPKHPYRELTLHQIEVAFISAIPYFIKVIIAELSRTQNARSGASIIIENGNLSDARKLVFTWPCVRTYVHPYLQVGLKFRI